MCMCMCSRCCLHDCEQPSAALTFCSILRAVPHKSYTRQFTGSINKARMSHTSRPARSAYFADWLDELLAVLAISYWVGSIVGQTLGTVVALCCLPNKIAVLFLAWQVGKRLLLAVPATFRLNSVPAGFRGRATCWGNTSNSRKVLCRDFKKNVYAVHNCMSVLSRSANLCVQVPEFFCSVRHEVFLFESDMRRP